MVIITKKQFLKLSKKRQKSTERFQSIYSKYGGSFPIDVKKMDSYQLRRIIGNMALTDEEIIKYDEYLKMVGEEGFEPSHTRIKV